MLNWQVNERMNEPIFGFLLFAILSLLDFLILSFHSIIFKSAGSGAQTR